MKIRRRGRVFLWLALMLLLAPGVARAQDKFSGPAIRYQLEESVRLQRPALRSLDEPERALALIWKAYEHLREGHTKMTNAKNHTKYPDAFFDISAPKLNQAREILLSARTALADPTRVVNGTPTEVAAQRIRESIRIIELVLVTTL